MIADMLVAEEAKKKGMSPDAYVESEISKRVKPVTDAEVVTFYQSNSNQMQGRTLEQMAPAINRYLADQQRDTARQALIAELKKAGPAMRVSLDAPRHDGGAGGHRSRARPRRRRPVTLVEFSDFQCPFCQRVEPTLKRLRQTYGDKLRIVWKDFPLTQIHPQAFKAGEAGALRGRPGQVLGVSRSAVRQPAGAPARRLEEARRRSGPRRGGVRRVPRLVQARRARARRRVAGHRRLA